MDSGKPIKESRDVDVPLAAAHFWYYAGWADKLEYAFPGRVARPLGVAAQIIPWNFPLLMLAWKIAPALAAGNTVVLKPASTTPLSALLFADVCRQADLPPGVVNIVTGPGEIGMSLVTHPGVDKVAFTGSTEIGKLIAKGVAGTDKALTLELGGKAANIVFDDAPLDQAVEGIVNGIYFNQGEVCCAGSRLLVQESIAEPLIDKLKDRLSTIRVGDPLDKNTDVGAINSKSQLEKITELVAVRRRRGRRALPAGLRPARPRLLLPPDAVHQRRPEPPDRPRGDLRAGAVGADLPDAGRGGREGQQHGLRAVGRRSGPTRAAGSCEMVAKMKAGVVWANTFNRFDPTSPFGGYKESGFGREGGLHGLLRLRPARGSLMATRTPAARSRSRHVPRRRRARRYAGGRVAAPARIEVRKTYKLYIGGAFPRTEIGRSYVVSRADGDAARERLPRLAQGPARRGPRRAQGVRRLGRQDRDEPRPGPLPRRRADGGPARPVRRRGRGTPRGSRAAAARATSSIAPSTAGSGTPAGPTRSPRSSARPTRSRRRTSTSRSPSRPASSAIVAPETSSLLGLVSRLAPPLVTGNAVVVLASETRPLPAVTLTEVLATSDVPGGVVNVLTGLQAASSCRSSRRTTTSTRSTRGASPTTCGPRSSTLAADDIKRLLAPPDHGRRGPLRLARRRAPPSAPSGSPPSSR